MAHVPSSFSCQVFTDDQRKLTTSSIAILRTQLGSQGVYHHLTFYLLLMTTFSSRSCTISTIDTPPSTGIGPTSTFLCQHLQFYIYHTTHIAQRHCSSSTISTLLTIRHPPSAVPTLFTIYLQLFPPFSLSSTSVHCSDPSHHPPITISTLPTFHRSHPSTHTTTHFSLFPPLLPLTSPLLLSCFSSRSPFPR